ncbi:unnamed protein product [Caretta caretta]
MVKYHQVTNSNWPPGSMRLNPIGHSECCSLSFYVFDVKKSSRDPRPILKARSAETRHRNPRSWVDCILNVTDTSVKRRRQLSSSHVTLHPHQRPSTQSV